MSTSLSSVTWIPVGSNISATILPHKPRKTPPLYLSTNPSHVDLLQLSTLFDSSNHSCHRFPNLNQKGRVEPVDGKKLRVALDHSSVVISVFCKTRKDPAVGEFPGILDSDFGELFMRTIPGFDSKGELVGFGRAVSDNGLTASIYDVVVDPSLRRLGIGRMIINRIIRILTGKGIYDIAAICSEEERLFFRACGFGDDTLGSTTMMYTKPFDSFFFLNQP